MVQEKENIYYIAPWANEMITMHEDDFAEDFYELFPSVPGELKQDMLRCNIYLV